MEATIKELLSGSVPDPDAAEFAPIRADLARLFIRHKADLGMGDWPDRASSPTRVESPVRSWRAARLP
jgi:hypothetical protein